MRDRNSPAEAGLAACVNVIAAKFAICNWDRRAITLRHLSYASSEAASAALLACWLNVPRPGSDFPGRGRQRAIGRSSMDYGRERGEGPLKCYQRDKSRMAATRRTNLGPATSGQSGSHAEESRDWLCTSKLVYYPAFTVGERRGRWDACPTARVAARGARPPP